MKKFLSLALALLMLAVMLPVTAMADAGYVTVTITYNEEFSNKNAEAVTAAENAINGKQYSTLKEALDAFKGLFESNNPLYTEHNTNDRPVDKVTITVHGTVSSDMPNSLYKIEGKSVNKYIPMDVELIGADANATIDGFVQIEARVAGFHDWCYKESGYFTVSGITFTDRAQLSMGGGMQSPNSANKTTSDTLNINGCTFRNELRIYHNDGANTRTENITGNTFINDGTAQYAYVCQSSPAAGQTNTVNYKNNTISGFKRGIDLGCSEADFVLDNNKITSVNSEGRAAIQLTKAKTCKIENNTVDVNKGNAIQFYKGLAAETVTINNNTIKAPYLIWNEAGLDQNKITSEGNTLDIANPGKAMTKTDVIDSTTTINGTVVEHPTTIVIIQPAEDTRKTDDQKNPATGANDMVAAAAALMAVSALGMAVLTRKK